jgi:hypothetical protein
VVAVVALCLHAVAVAVAGAVTNGEHGLATIAAIFAGRVLIVHVAVRADSHDCR